MDNKLPVFEKVTPSLLEAMPYEYIGKDINICIETEDFTCLCPWTGLPDFAYIVLNYTPDNKVVELKSLKLYLQSYRMVGMVHESVVNNILNDLVKTVRPKEISIDIEFRVRGGITTIVSTQYFKKRKD
ncbi:NADPH-dependent 7-cyano-7-deazaguanine reductase [Endomicrobiia bacterium]|nr:NADPH-dependent 7-cyano-7-deazaguanine reductase [Endomicrobiia bacterium]GHT64111.1 NADPH-dependent 7-cyano-7-deazaguanine reductase [Endomicrobiia bacterium]GHT71914.1 NADPH-dependent 7-cyano-7-deazaguanine reductase [Endomicrobiia bacterium]GHT71917.1 NADPH-dependent 7-cyano-7-deazaguanine reductase [Endomicrobiia bacterium]GHT74192.1 NADPH-dependent 7-cyano-7-deazaguanine reductase [Endomicrobiia bacterium]